VEITPGLRTLVERKLAKLIRVLGDKGVSGQVELRLERLRRVAELHVHVRGDHLFQATAAATAWDLALGQAADKVVQQVQKQKSKWQERKREAQSVPAVSDDALPPAQIRRIVKARRYAIKALTLDQAAHEVGPLVDAFVVFRNIATDAVSILYRRKDGDLGLIEPQA
jgi:putative sigma-54 modulation protein